MLVFSMFISLFFSSSLAFNFFEAIKKPCAHVLRFWKKKEVKKIEGVAGHRIAKGILLYLTASYLFWVSIYPFSKRLYSIGKINELNEPKSFPKDLFYAMYLLYTSPIEYFTGWRTLKVDSEYEKLSRACKCLFNKKAKSMLNNIDINAVFGERKHNERGFKPIHIAVRRANFEIIRWLIEKKYADITALDNGDLNVFYHVRYADPSYLIRRFNDHLHDKIRAYLSDACDRHESLVSKVADLKNDIDLYVKIKKEGGYEEVCDKINRLESREERKKAFEESMDEDSTYRKNLRFRDGLYKKSSRILYLMKNPKTPGYTKQLVMSDLVYIYEKNSLVFSGMRDFYKEIVFNYTFLNDERFRKAAIFAGKRNIKDRNGKTVLQAYAQYGQDNGLLAQIASSKVGGDKKAIKNYFSYKPDPRRVKSICNKFFVVSKLLSRYMKSAANKVKNLFYTEKYDAQKESLNYLLAAKKAGNKKGFRDFANREIIKGYVARVAQNPDKKQERKVTENIMEFAGADFGNKLYYR